MAKILIADDSRVHVQLLPGWSRDRGFVVISALDAVQAWMMGIRCQPDVIILDINMPGGFGLDALKRLKQSTKAKHIPLLVGSGSGGSEMRDLVQRPGAADLFEKPPAWGRLCAAAAGLIA
jgi:CheY-like chemotaxis protein